MITFITRLYIVMLCMTFSLALPLKAQSLSPDQWYHINTPHTNLIFRGRMYQEAQRVANTLNHLYDPVSQSLGVFPSPIPLILWDQNFDTNGSFAFPPRRIDFQNGAPQRYNFLGTNDWFSLLAVHEFRHAVQHAKLKRNFNQWLYWLGGDLALGTITGPLVPAWLFEGDAVSIETALTKSGRGRIPYFSVLYKANLLERGGFSYSKQIIKSFKHQIPDHYRVGYFITTHLRRKYGANVLSDIMEKMTWPMLFPIAVKKVTGKSLLQIYKDTNAELKDLWTKQLEGLKLTPATSMTARHDTTYNDYNYPQLDENGKIIVLKAGLDTPSQFVILDEQGQEQSLFIPGQIHQDVSFSVSRDQIVWTESVLHPRWKDRRRYGIIQRYDIRKKQLKTLTHQSRYGTAALSPDASKIIAVESDTSYRHRLVILDANDGKVLHRISNPENYFYLTPKWLPNGRLVVAVKHHQQKATLTLIDTLTGEEQDLIPYSEENIGVPVPYGKYILYNSAYSGIDNIYALDLGSHKRYQITSRKYGAYNPTVSSDGHWLIFNDFTKDGMDVVKMPLTPEEWTPLEEVEDRSIHYYAPLVEQENNSDVLSHIPSQTYPVAPYYPAKHLFQLHSWTWPLPPPKSKYEPTKPGLMLHSEDLLRTTKFKVGYLYDREKHAGETFAQLAYEGWYPIVSLRLSLEKDYERQQADMKKIAALKFKLPLEFSQGQYTNGFSISTTSSISTRDNPQISQFEQLYQGHVFRTTKRSPRDLYAPWQQQLTVSYSHTPYRKQYAEDIHVQKLRVKPAFRFPGILRHHSLLFSPQYERVIATHMLADDDPVTYLLAGKDNKITISGGAKNSYKAMIAYDLPILYPDWDLGGLFYIKQIAANLFYQPEYLLSASKTQYEYNTGLAITMYLDFSFLRAPLKVGWYVAYDSKRGFQSQPTLTYRL